MGGGQSKPTITLDSKKRIVIVGGSFSGQMITKKLVELDGGQTLAQGGNLEIVIIDKNEHFEYICQIWECIKDDFWNNNTVKFEDAIKSFGSPNVSFQQGLLTEVHSEDNKISVQRTNGEVESVDYDALIIAVGATYNSPWKGDSDSLQTFDGRKTEWDTLRSKIQSANSVCVIGAGSTGLETVACIKEFYPEKQVGVAIRGQVLMSSQQGAHKLIEPELEKIGVACHYGVNWTSQEDKIKTKTDEDYEIYIDCRGYSFTAPKKFMTGDLAQCVDIAKGQIQVDLTGRVTNIHPIATKKSENPKTYQSIFSFGDVSISPANEPKTIITMYQLVEPFSKNVFEQVIGHGYGQHEYTTKISRMGFTPLGTKSGVMTFNQMVRVDSGIANEKTKIQVRNVGSLKGIAKYQKESKKADKDVPGMISFSQGNCSCLPMHYSKQEAIDEADLSMARGKYDMVYEQRD